MVDDFVPRRTSTVSSDLAYKRLFSEPEMIHDLLVGFVHEDWIKDLDFTTLERLESQFLTKRQRERASGLIWRVQFRGHWLYLHLSDLSFRTQSARRRHLVSSRSPYQIHCPPDKEAPSAV